MSCEFVVGNDGAIQLGFAHTWGIKSDATIRIPFETEGLSYVPNYAEAASIIGSTLKSRVEILDEHVEGDISTYVTPDEIRYYLLAALGKEYAPVDNSDSSYTHYYVPLRSGGLACLPILSGEIDRVEEIMEYNSLKVSSVGISAAKNDYLKVNLSLVGEDETDGGALAAGLNLSSKSYFKFRGASVFADIGSGEVEMEEVTNVDFSFDNALPTDRKTSYSKGKLTEVNPQGRSSTLSLTVYLSSTINTMRKNIFKLGVPMRVVLEFEVSDLIDTGIPFMFGIALDNVYLTEVPYNIDGPDEMEFDLSFMVADHDDVDFVGNDSGIATKTIATTATSMTAGDLVKVKDPDGFWRVFKYKGDTVTVAASTITFTASADEQASEVEPIFDGSDIFNSTDWEIAEGVVAYAMDDDDAAVTIPEVPEE
jgi:hypothetical protein